MGALWSEAVTEVLRRLPSLCSTLFLSLLTQSPPRHLNNDYNAHPSEVFNTNSQLRYFSMSAVIVVIGARGATGKLIVNQAINKGRFVSNNSKIPFSIFNYQSNRNAHMCMLHALLSLNIMLTV